ARAFSSARIWIEVPETDVFLCGLVGDFPNANVRVSYRNVCDWREIEIEELTGDPENTFTQFLELEIWFDFVLVQIVFRLADLLHVVAIVPWLDLDLRAFLVGERLHVRNFLVNARH